MLELILLRFIGILSKVDFTPMYFCRVNLSLASPKCGIGVVLFLWNPLINSLFSRSRSEKVE